ncbi:shikimate dehydrogenase [Streptomyces sulphureus]|uniref:shikimate dehydrogenase n=1 Tax=Streptomyces sulphureus TaxID=47758 RepID=UPI0003673D36|nr:shikimate dehydrogenase [Streptomyces sulphureus]
MSDRRHTAHRRHRAAVLGSPIAHSLSPVLHRAAYEAMGLADFRYERHRVEEDALAGFLEGLGPEWAGLSLTMPLKRAVIPLLDEVSATAASVEAVNTVVFTEDGRRGDNTDIPGLVAALAERGVGAVEEASVLGAGATASSAVAALGRMGVPRVTAYVRGPERAREMRGWGERLGVEVRAEEWARAASGLTAPLVVSTTPAGPTAELAGSVPRTPGVLFDVLYEPWPTPLAAAWSAAGGPVLGGLDLLVHQAVLQVEQMTGKGPAPVEAMRKAGEEALRAG